MTQPVVNRVLREFLAEHWSASARGRYVQIRRATRPGSWLYLTFLSVVALATDYGTAHPIVFYFFSTLILLKTGARILLVYTPRHYFTDQRFWNRAINFIVLATGLLWGAFLATTIVLYGLSSSVTLLILICTVGTTTGSITAYSPSLRLLTAFLVFLLAPSICVELSLGTRPGTALAILTGIFLAFLFWQGRLLNMIHKRRVAATLLASKRSKELEDQVAARTSELNAAKEAAEAASRAKSAFLANVSHEIRTPMHGVLGMTEVARSNDNSPNTAACLEDIKTSGESLLRIIDDLLDLSKLEARKLPLEMQPFSLRDCLRKSIKPLSWQAEQKSLPMNLSIDAAVADVMVGDQLRVHQIVTNLVHNAIKFTDKGHIAVSVRPAGSAIHISVEDTGCGIPAGKQSHVFEAFSQADDSTTRRFGGTGLGLAICKGLTQLMGGTLSLEANQYGGSTFHVVLPRHANANPLARSATGQGGQ